MHMLPNRGASGKQTFHRDHGSSMLNLYMNTDGAWKKTIVTESYTEYFMLEYQS